MGYLYENIYMFNIFMTIQKEGLKFWKYMLKYSLVTILALFMLLSYDDNIFIIFCVIKRNDSIVIMLFTTNEISKCQPKEFPGL